ncbi:DUF4262 domain-containing protein [Vibrio anguillarum]|uniref:DUF4262 domain-containing protein n=1 Tax=Vibrio anguillarum TaxID=55601 RepID=UPI000BB4FB5D|nr:DUF4262 domain-containing protein [Vibrio anguillarum]ATC60295.1 hypothetical protein CMV05_23175 [Vibrio anguillarum]
MAHGKLSYEAQLMKIFEHVKDKVENQKQYQIIQDEGGEFNPAYSYTVGLTHIHHLPEIALLGFEPKQSNAFLKITAKYLINNPLDFAHEYVLLERAFNLPVYLVKIPQHNSHKHFHLGRKMAEYLQHEQEIFLLVLPDENGLFPWSKGINVKYRKVQSTLMPLKGPGTFH